MATTSFEEKVLECVDRGMRSLGKSSMQAIYWHIMDKHGIKREEIPRNPQEFIKSLQTMFGSGAYVLEKLIVIEMRLDFKISDAVESFEAAVIEAERVGISESESSSAKHLRET